jgi:y4mF family transcriptional regulator
LFPFGIFLAPFQVNENESPEREIHVDIPRKFVRFYRSVNIMAKRVLTPAEIGDIIRTARKTAGLRQDQLAGAAGVGLRFIVDIEAGKPTAQIGKVLEVLQALGCSFDITAPPAPKGARKA